MRPVRLARVSNPYGRPGPYAAGVHTGVDFAARAGTNIFGRWVRAVDDGVVIVSGYDSNYGNWIVVRSHDGGGMYVHGYCHLHKRVVQNGARVRRGRRIGRIGSTGFSTGPHCHYFENPGQSYSYYAHRKPRHCWGETWPKIKARIQRRRRRLRKKRGNRR